MPLVFSAVICLVGFFATLCGTASAETTNSVISICETLPNPDGTDSKDNEYFKLKNNMTDPVMLDSWKICNISSDCYVLRGSLEPNSCQKILRQDFNFTLHNDKEELSLFDANQNLIDKVITGSAPSGKVWLCFSGQCQWDTPRESCDYSDLISASTDDSANDTQNEEEGPETGSADSAATAESAEETSEKKSPSRPKIATKEDWQKIEKEMSEKNLLSLVADIQGRLVVPLNIVRPNTFYIRSAQKLITVNIYSSRQGDFTNIKLLYQAGSRVKITHGYLKNKQLAWQVGIGKNSRVDFSSLPSKRKKIARNLALSPDTNITKHEGESVKIAGKILKKSGSYFYVEDKNSQKALTAYIPEIVWTRYLERNSLGIFPVYQQRSSTSTYKGKDFQATGLIEVSGNTCRILIARPEDLAIGESKEKKSKEKKKEDEKKNNSNDNNSANKESAEETKNEETILSIQQEESKNSNPPASLETLEMILSKKLRWDILGRIAYRKLQQYLSGWFYL